MVIIAKQSFFVSSYQMIFIQKVQSLSSCAVANCSLAFLWWFWSSSSTEELWNSQRNSGSYLLDQGPSPPIAYFGWAANSRKSLGGSKLLPLKNDRGHCVLGDHQCCRHLKNANISKKLFSLGHYGGCRLLRIHIFLIHFRIRL
jgi:hypothetical protein